jgi:hypothetical protein
MKKKVLNQLTTYFHNMTLCYFMNIKGNDIKAKKNAFVISGNEWMRGEFNCCYSRVVNDGTESCILKNKAIRNLSKKIFVYVVTFVTVGTSKGARRKMLIVALLAVLFISSNETKNWMSKNVYTWFGDIFCFAVVIKLQQRYIESSNI